VGFEHLGIEYLTALLRKDGHEVRLFYDPSLFDDKMMFSNRRLNWFFDIKEALIERLLDYEPDIVGFSVVTNTYRWSLDIAERIKKRSSAIIIFGGVHPTVVPDVVIGEPCVDIVNVGEGFESFPELVNMMSKGEDYTGIKNIWIKKENIVIRNEIRPVFKDLDILPFPAKDIFKSFINATGLYMTMASLGCPNKCSFCYNENYQELYRGKGAFLRRRSPAGVIEELSLAIKEYSIKVVLFADDIFTISLAWLKEFLPLYKKNISLPFQVCLHVDFVTEETIAMLKDAGCWRVEIAVQSIDEHTRKSVLNRRESNLEIERVIGLCGKYKLKYRLDHIFGIPGETEEQQIAAAEFYTNLSFQPARFDCFYLVYYPGTEIQRHGLASGAITESDVEKINNGFIPTLHHGGSVKSRKDIEMFGKYEVLFRLISILPSWLSGKLNNKRLLNVLRVAPKSAVIVLDFIGSIVQGDILNLLFARYYLVNMFKLVLFKIRLINAW
jgi:tRNA A37 methylthiotransferase MiaB